MLTLASPWDAPAIDVLFAAAFAEYRRAMGQEGDGPRPWIAAAVEAGEAYLIGDRLGAVVMSRSGTTLRIDSIGIDPARQGGGTGRAALAAIEDHARETGATEIALHTGQRFTRLVAFYSRAGYRVVAVGPHPKGRDDRLRVFMVKSLV